MRALVVIGAVRSRMRIGAIVAILGVAVVLGLVLIRWPRTVSGVATLDQCYWGWPIVELEGEGSIAVATWPDGLRFDEASGSLLDTSGRAVLRTGDRVHVVGQVIEVHGDPSPCFSTIGIRIEEIVGAA